MLPSSVLDDSDVRDIERDVERDDEARSNGALAPNPPSDCEERNLGDEGQVGQKHLGKQRHFRHAPNGVPKSAEHDSEHLESEALTEHDVQLKQEVVRMQEDFAARCGQLVRIIERRDRKPVQLRTEHRALSFGETQIFDDEATEVPTKKGAKEMDGILPSTARHLEKKQTHQSIIARLTEKPAKTSGLPPSSRGSVLRKMRQKTGLHLAAGGGLKAPPRVFIDPENLKKELKIRLSKKQYNVSQYYWEDGIAQRIAQSSIFELATSVCMVLNALWLGVDTDMNNAATLADVEPIFVIVENLFCTCFLAEWAVRFGAFKHKANCLKDGWFLFDSFLVTIMVFETWVLGLVTVIVGGAALPSFAAFRILRLTRMARMARLVKFFPEFAVMLKAMIIGIRSVFWTLVFLCTLVYGFAITFTQLLDGKNQPEGSVARENFQYVRDSWSTLLLLGALPDQREMMKDLGNLHPGFWLLMLIYLFFASITLMNMLTGTLVEVVRVISQVEYEEAKLTHLRQSLEEIMQSNDMDCNGTLNHQEFLGILTETKYSHVLNDLGIDVPGLIDLVDAIFEDDEERELTFDDLTTVVFGLRDQNAATVKDLSEQSNMIVAEVKKRK